MAETIKTEKAEEATNGRASRYPDEAKPSAPMTLSEFSEKADVPIKIIQSIIALYMDNKAWQDNMCGICDKQRTYKAQLDCSQADRIKVCEEHRHYASAREPWKIREELGVPKREPII